jgi:hypothetical protein
MDLIELDVEVEGNVDRLSALAVHDLYVRMVDRIVDDGRYALEMNAVEATGNRYPRPTPGAMARHVDSSGPHDVGAEVSAEIGVTKVEEARARPYASFFRYEPEDYPLFRDQGTVAYGSPTGGIMRFEGREGKPVFRRRVKGQLGAEFLLETYQEMIHGIVPAYIDQFGREVEGLA